MIGETDTRSREIYIESFQLEAPCVGHFWPRRDHVEDHVVVRIEEHDRDTFALIGEAIRRVPEADVMLLRLGESCFMSKRGSAVMLRERERYLTVDFMRRLPLGIEIQYTEALA